MNSQSGHPVGDTKVLTEFFVVLEATNKDVLDGGDLVVQKQHFESTGTFLNLALFQTTQGFQGIMINPFKVSPLMSCECNPQES